MRSSLLVMLFVIGSDVIENIYHLVKEEVFFPNSHDRFRQIGRSLFVTTKIKVTPLQARIISSAFLQADASAISIAQETKTKEKTVRATLHSLSERGVIQPFPKVNIHALGFTDYCIFLSFASEKVSTKEKLIKFFTATPTVAWVAETCGEFHFSISLFSKSIFQVDEFLSQLARDNPGVTLEKQLALRVEWTSFRCKFWGNQKSKIDSITRTRPASEVTIDATDHLILQQLSKSPLAAHSLLAREVKIPVNTFAYRIASLKERGILLGTVFHLDAHRVGLYQARLLIFAKSAQTNLTDRLRTYAAKHVHISAFIRCIGSWDYELNLEVFSPDQISDITEEIYKEFGSDLRVIKALTVLRTIKCLPYPFAQKP
jgi:DNA-binding Lrp family transcriptional regulator